MKVAVVGNGHVGLVLAACLAEMGYDVTGIDRQATVELLNRGEVGFIEPGLSEMVHRHVRDGRLHATTRLEDVKGSRIVWIAVGTMQTPDGAIHIDDIKQIVVKLGQLCSTDTVIAIKSTMPVGACRRLARKLPVNGPPLVYNPEFLRQGSAIYDFLHPGKVVLGTGPQGGAEPLAEAYKSFCCPHIYTNWETAEIIKLVQNAFNALRISFLNEITLATEGLDVSLGMLSRALRENEPALRRYMNPGFSYGGSCLPNNIAYLTYFAR